MSSMRMTIMGEQEDHGSIVVLHSPPLCDNPADVIVITCGYCGMVASLCCGKQIQVFFKIECGGGPKPYSFSRHA
jgi:hypothetical protein